MKRYILPILTSIFLAGLTGACAALVFKGCAWPAAALLIISTVCCLGAIWFLCLYDRAVTELISGRRMTGPRWRKWFLCSSGLRLLADHMVKTAELSQQASQAALRVQLLDRQKQQIEAVLHGLWDAVIVVDQSDRILLANRAAGQLFGFESGKVMHQRLDQLLGPEHHGIVEFIHQVRKGKNSPARMELRWPTDGGHYFYDCIACCVRDQQGGPSGAVVVLHDLTRERQLASAKNDFVSYVSHELKTPLASIMAYAEMLIDGEARDQQAAKQFIRVILDQAARLNRLVEDILNISRIESGLIKVKKEPLSLALIAQEQLEMITAYAQEKGITLIGHRPIVYDQVMADRDLMSMVLANLLSNAVKYNSPGGTVTVTTEVDDAKSVVRVTVTDTGVGIPPDQQRGLFEKFYRAPANADRAGGTGLGLNLVKQIVEKLHAGRVFFHSQVGAGSTFGFELPLVSSRSRQQVTVDSGVND